MSTSLRTMGEGIVSKSKQKGTAAESAVMKYLQCNGWPDVERRTLSGVNDRGDIAGLRSVVIEVKDCARMDLAGWIGEAEQERINAGASHGVVWHKRRGKGSPADWYVTMTGDQFVRLLTRLYGGA